MPSLTPLSRAEEVSSVAMREGLITGGLTLVPSYGALWLAMKRPAFVKSTNWQSRTALVIMPALFMFAYSAESKLNQRMHEIAEQSTHSRGVAEWAEQKVAEDKVGEMIHKAETISTEERLTELYRHSIANSGVRIVSGEKLGLHHQIANYWQANPFKVLAILGVPTVAWIFYGRSHQEHLQTQMKVMHTRVMGQFSVIALLLGLMGFKEYMDRNGKFITEADANARVSEMHAVREQLLQRLEHEKAIVAAKDKKIAEAHAKDLATGQVHKKKHNKKQHVAVTEIKA